MTNYRYLFGCIAITMTSCAGLKVVELIETPVAIEVRLNKPPKKDEVITLRGKIIKTRRGEKHPMLVGSWVSEKTIRFLPKSADWLNKCVEIKVGNDRLPIENLKRNTFIVKQAGEIFNSDKDFRHLGNYNENLTFKGRYQSNVDPSMCKKLSYPPEPPRPKIYCDIDRGCYTMARNICKKVINTIDRCSRKPATFTRVLCEEAIEKTLTGLERIYYKKNRPGQFWQGLLDDATRSMANYTLREPNMDNALLTLGVLIGSMHTKNKIIRQCRDNILKNSVGRIFRWRHKIKLQKEMVDRVQSICIEQGYSVPTLRARDPVTTICNMGENKSELLSGKNDNSFQIIGPFWGPRATLKFNYIHEVEPSETQQNQGAGLRFRFGVFELVGQVVRTADKRTAADIGAGLSFYDGMLFNPYAHLSVRSFLIEDQITNDPYNDCRDSNCKTKLHGMLSMGNRFSLPISKSRNNSSIGLLTEYVHPLSDRIPDFFRFSLDIAFRTSPR